MFCDFCGNYIFTKKFPNSFSKEIKTRYGINDIEYLCENCYERLQKAEEGLIRSEILQKHKDSVKKTKKA